MNHQPILTKDMPADLSGLKLWNLPTVRRPSLRFLQNSCTAGAAACKGGIP